MPKTDEPAKTPAKKKAATKKAPAKKAADTKSTATKTATTRRRRPKKQPMLLAHWKGFRSFEDARSFLHQLAAYHGERSLYLALPYNHLELLSADMPGPSITLGSTSMACAREGSFTEPVAADLVRDAGGQFVLIGDRDSRQRLQEGDEDIQAKIKKCVSEGLSPMLGIGESIAEYRQQETESVLRQQLEGALSGLTAAEQSGVTVVYDACWSLRFDGDSSTENFEGVYTQVRELLKEVIGAAPAKKAKVLIALPPYLDDLSQIPDAKVDGFYMSKASVMPQALTTIAAPEAFAPLATMSIPEGVEAGIIGTTSAPTNESVSTGAAEAVADDEAPPTAAGSDTGKGTAKRTSRASSATKVKGKKKTKAATTSEVQPEAVPAEALEDEENGIAAARGGAPLQGEGTGRGRKPRSKAKAASGAVEIPTELPDEVADVDEVEPTEAAEESGEVQAVETVEEPPAGEPHYIDNITDHCD